MREELIKIINVLRFANRSDFCTVQIGLGVVLETLSLENIAWKFGMD